MRLFMCMHAQEVFFQIRSIKKPVMFFKNGCKKIVLITKCNLKNCLKCITLQKKLSSSPKNGNPPPPPPPNKNIMVCHLLVAIQKIRRWLNCVCLWSALNQYKKRWNPSSTWITCWHISSKTHDNWQPLWNYRGFQNFMKIGRSHHIKFDSQKWQVEKCAYIITVVHVTISVPLNIITSQPLQFSFPSAVSSLSVLPIKIWCERNPPIFTKFWKPL